MTIFKVGDKVKRNPQYDSSGFFSPETVYTVYRVSCNPNELSCIWIEDEHGEDWGEWIAVFFDLLPKPLPTHPIKVSEINPTGTMSLAEVCAIYDELDAKGLIIKED